MPTEDNIKEVIWRQLIELIEADKLFFPEKIRKRINDGAKPFLADFLKTMIDCGMIVEFKQKSLSNRIAHWIFKVKMRKKENRENLLEIYVRGPEWERLKKLSFAQVTGEQKDELLEPTLH